jgi:hypothetical protein
VIGGVATHGFGGDNLQSPAANALSLDWAGWSRRILAAAGRAPDDILPQIHSARIEVAVGPAAICASYLAAETGRPFRLVETFSDILVGSQHPRDRIIVATLDQAEDGFLFSLLDRFALALDANQPWCEVPRFTLVIARNLASLSWLVAKLVMAGRSLPPGETRLRHYSPSKAHSEVTELEIVGEAGSFRRSLMTAPGLLDSYKESANVFAFATHGSESCANGGDGTVLCGLELDGAKFGPLDEGVLACGRGFDCPRGPHPVPLSRMAADVLMLATCNGLRLADSRYREQFNFAFSFIDGPGVGYVSPVFTSTGAELASLAFLGAMAEGYTLGEATALSNAFVHCAGVERPAYIAIGDPEYRVRSRAAHEPLPALNSLPATLDLGDVRFIKLDITDPFLVDAAQRNRLVISVVPEEEGDSPGGFHRVEQLPDGRDSILTLFLFRFPHPLGRVRIEAADRDEVCKRTRAALDTFKGWVDTCRLIGLDAAAPDDYDELRRSEDEIQMLMARNLALLSIDGGAVAQLEALVEATRELTLATTEVVLDLFAPQLEGSFWLPNILAPAHCLERVDRTTCPSCGRAAFHRTIRHVLTHVRRAVVVCPRCGICADFPAGSAIEEVIINAANLTPAGEEFHVTVRVRLNRAATVRVSPRLSTHEEKTPPPSPVSATASTAGTGTVDLDFVFRLAPGLSPHRHYVKLLAATEDGLAFASRPFFVRAPAPTPESALVHQITSLRRD